MKWNLELIYKTDAEYEQSINEVLEIVDLLTTFRVDLRNNLEQVLIKSLEIEQYLSRISLYATMKFHLNQKDNENQKEYHRIENLVFDIGAKTSWLRPAIIALENEIGQEAIFKLLSDIVKDDYSHYLEKVFNMNKYTLDAKSEEFIVSLEKSREGFVNAYTMLTSSDYSEKVISLSVGDVTLSDSNYTQLLSSLKNQDDRRIVFETYFGYLKDHQNTLATIYINIITLNSQIAKFRGFNSSLEAELAFLQIPKEVYFQLVKCVKDNSSVVKEFNEYKRVHIGLEKYHTYDRFVKINTTDKKYSYEEALDICYQAAATVNDEYLSLIQEVTTAGRVDVLPADGKRTGAYSWGCVESGPMILLNYDETLNYVYTLMHEAGHSVHTQLALKNQKLVNASYPIYLAEIASTFAEAILDDYLLEQETDVNVLKSLLEESIGGKVATFIRQTLFAEYELNISTRIDNNESLTADDLNKEMQQLYFDYYGIDLDKEEAKKLVWAYIPHLFHTPFYVYQYATCLAASLAIFAKYKNSKDEGIKILFNILSAGGSKYPNEILLDNGIDLSNEQTYKDVFKVLKYRIGQLKEL